VHLGIVVAKCGHNRKSVKRLGRKVGLPGVGIGTAFQVIEKNGGDLCIPKVFLIGYQLVHKIGAEIFNTQRRVPSVTKRQSQCQVQSVGPGLFYIRGFLEKYPASGRQYPDVVGNAVWSTVPPSCIGSENQVLRKIIAQVYARCEQPAIKGVVIGPCPGYENQLFSPFKGVFPVGSINTFFPAQVKRFLSAGRPPVCQYLVKILHQSTDTGR